MKVWHNKGQASENNQRKHKQEENAEEEEKRKQANHTEHITVECWRHKNQVDGDDENTARQKYRLVADTRNQAEQGNQLLC